jgi:uncharacterized damage-inducible protein DinB
MDRAEHARLLVAYERWANQRIVSNLFGLAEDDANTWASWGTVFGSMIHLVASHAVWLGRFRDTLYPLAIPTSLPELEGALRRTHTELAAFAGGLTDRDWERLVRFRDSRNNPHEEYLGVLLSHVVNHGTHHRGEAALLLTRAGRSPGDLDLVVYRRQVDPGR